MFQTTDQKVIKILIQQWCPIQLWIIVHWWETLLFSQSYPYWKPSFQWRRSEVDIVYCIQNTASPVHQHCYKQIPAAENIEIDVKSRCCFLNHPISRPVGLMLHHPIPRGLANFNNISNSSVGDGLWNCICHKKLGKMNGQQNDIGDWERRTSTRLLSTLLWITKLCCNLFRSQQQ